MLQSRMSTSATRFSVKWRACPQSKHHCTLILWSLSYSTFRNVPHCLRCSLNIIYKINTVKCMQCLLITYILKKKSFHKFYRWNTNTLFHLAIFHFRKGFLGTELIFHDIALTTNQDPTYNEQFDIWQGYPPVCLRRWMNIWCAIKIRIVLHLIDINEITCLIKTRHRTGSTTTK